MGFSFDQLGGHRKILDFANRSSDSGLYNLSTSLNFYPVSSTVNGQFQAGVVHRVVFTRDAAKTVVSYVDGNPRLTFTDASDLAVIGSVLNFFQDDFAFGPFESASGFVDYIQIYDTALTGSQVVTGIPEPSRWAMLIVGLGLVGATMRRRAAAANAA